MTTDSKAAFDPEICPRCGHRDCCVECELNARAEEEAETEELYGADPKAAITDTKAAVGTQCPHCGNQYGFAFGTCFECGFNYLDNTFHFIVVWQPHGYVDDWLIIRHANKTYQKFNRDD